MSELTELEDGFEALKRKNKEYLPKVDPALVHDLLRRERENPAAAPMYLVEVFTRPGLDTGGPPIHHRQDWHVPCNIRQWDSLRDKPETDNRNSKGDIGF